MSVILSLTILRGRNLPVADITTSDPYVKFVVGDKSFKTSVIKETLDPIWNETYQVITTIGEQLIFKVMDQDFGKKDDSIGNCYWNVPAMSKGEVVYDILQNTMKGFLYIKAECLSTTMEKSVTLFDFEKKTLLRVKVRSVYSYLDSLIPVLKPKDVNLKTLADMRYLIDIGCTSTPPQRLSRVITARDKPAGNFVEFDDEIYIRAMVNEKIYFNFYGKQKGAKNYTEICVAEFPVPDFLQDEKTIQKIPFKTPGYVEIFVQCLDSVYNNVDKEKIPSKKIIKNCHQIVRMKISDSIGFTSFMYPCCIIEFNNQKFSSSPVLYHKGEVDFNAFFNVEAKPGTQASISVFNKDLNKPNENGKLLCDGKFVVPDVKIHKEPVVIAFNKTTNLKVEFFKVGGVSKYFGDVSTQNKSEKTREKIELVFEKFDRRRRGYLDRAQFRTAIQYLVPVVEKTLSVFIFAYFNKDGKVYLDNLRDAIDVLKNHNTPKEITQLFFDYVDLDHSGTIEFDEFKVFAQKTGLATDDEDLENLFQKYDVDKTNFVSFQQFEKMVQSLKFEE
ncbi:calcium binding protein, putative [Entamoeba invadens IP1]|uniref:Calcium binding protein, putative n=1 Tax=Entamoeba invadens IP1 TaxID=370355 RepID=A0A0A1TZ92_ENTIV|nr:calcium binding protein, putative [Entamoeba invadens IP1]ELP86892.1 calcium binding protein, putative [Entamoeba invadens IP1]|eukprot:XP_004253663.1 calcium binding protein, putative [Entamoeba invadens IP1]